MKAKKGTTKEWKKEGKKMNSLSFDIQSIYAMKNVDFICFWCDAAHPTTEKEKIFLCIIPHKQINGEFASINKKKNSTENAIFF